MRLFLNLVVVIAVLSGCNAVDATDEGVDVATRQDAVSTGPTSLANWRWGTPFFPSTARSAYLVAVQHPTDPNAFLAWGFDVVTGDTYFFVTGSTRSDFSRLLTQFNNDIAVPTRLDPQFVHHIVGQLGKKGPGQPQPPGPGNDWTQMNAYGRNIATQLHAAQLAAY